MEQLLIYIKRYYQYGLLGLAVAAGAVCWYTPAVHRYLRNNFVPSEEPQVVSAATPTEDRLGAVEERAKQTEAQLNALVAQRQQDLAAIATLQEDYKRAVAEVGQTQDELVKQGEALQKALASVPGLSSSTAAPASGEQQNGKVNINTATAAELDTLPGIGPSYAQRIIDYRTKNGPFKSIDDLDNVEGIGPATLAKLRDLVTL